VTDDENYPTRLAVVVVVVAEDLLGGMGNGGRRERCSKFLTICRTNNKKEEVE